MRFATQSRRTGPCGKWAIGDAYFAQKQTEMVVKSAFLELPRMLEITHARLFAQ
jgi:hypothetical protein